MTTEDKIKVMQAYVDGKKIEFKKKCEKEWISEHMYADGFTWDWRTFDYRIKPEEHKDTYRSYTDTVEMIKDYMKRTDNILVGSSVPIIWIKDKNIDKGAYLISAFYEKGVSLFNGQCGADLKELFDNYVYMDGSPIGKKDE